MKLTAKLTQNKFAAIGAKILRASEDGTKELAEAIVEDARERVNTPGGAYGADFASERTGETAEGIQATALDARNYEIESTAEHSAALEFGHLQHPGQYVDVGGGFRLVRNWVAAKPFFVPALEAGKDKAKRIFGKITIGA